MVARMEQVTADRVHIVEVKSNAVGEMQALASGGGAPAYKGQTVFTPSDQAQIVPVSGYRMKADITIEAIPSNYGRILWNGSYLKVY